jgi:peroxiredoxin family protein
MENKNKVALVVFSGDLDKLLASFIIATGAAASGMQVSMFFTFWGLKLIQQKSAGAAKIHWMKRMLGWFVKPGPDQRTLSKMNMLGLGPAMIKHLMKKSKVPSLAELMETAKALGVKFTACTTSMEIMGVTKDRLSPQVDAVAGVTSFLKDARESDFTLFI